MTPQEQFDSAPKELQEAIKQQALIGFISRSDYIKGGLKGMEIQKEIDRQEIERLQDLLIRAYHLIDSLKYEDLCTEIEKELKLLNSPQTSPPSNFHTG